MRRGRRDRPKTPKEPPVEGKGHSQQLSAPDVLGIPQQFLSQVSRKDLAVLLVVVVLTAGIFVLDMLTPLDFEVWVLYLFPIFLSTRLRSKWASIAVGAVCVGLAILAAFLSSPNIHMEENLVHRSMETLTLAIAALLLFQRKRGEVALQESHALLQAVIEGSTDAIFVKDLRGRYVMINSAGACIVGKTRAEIIGKDDTELFPPETARRLMDWDQHIMKTAETVTREEIVTASGITRTFLSMKGVSRDQDGHVIGLIGIARDISERKRAEEALRESKERFRLIMEHANDAIFYIDLNGEIQWASHQAEVLTGQPKDKFRDCTIMTLLAPESVAVAETRLDAVRRGEAVAPLVEIEFLRPDGMMIWGEANITSVQLGGETIGRLLVVRDITERKVAEEALRETDQQLRQLLDDRERFSQNLHDNIIQMLYAIGLGIEESQRLIGEDSKTAVKNLSNAVKDLNAVMRDVRSYIAWSEPKILSGQQLKAAIEHLARTIKGAHLLQFRLQVDTMAASQLTAEEANHVLHIVREAMSNSLRHSRAKTGVVMLQMRKGRVHLQVEDDGVGFDPADNEGTGQGLCNIRARAKELGAKLEIVSEPGHGVRIALDIPEESEHASA